MAIRKTLESALEYYIIQNNDFEEFKSVNVSLPNSSLVISIKTKNELQVVKILTDLYGGKSFTKPLKFKYEVGETIITFQPDFMVKIKEEGIELRYLLVEVGDKEIDSNLVEYRNRVVDAKCEYLSATTEFKCKYEYWTPDIINACLEEQNLDNLII